MTDPQLVEFMTAKQVAERAGVTVARVHQLCREDKLKSLKAAGVWLIFRDSALEWIYSDRKRGRPRKGEAK